MRVVRTYQQIGEIMGLDTKTVRMTYQKAMRKIKAYKILTKKPMLKGFNADYSSDEFYIYGEFIQRKCDGKVVDILKS